MHIIGYYGHNGRGRSLSLDILRIIACMGVIMIHTSGSPIVHQMVEIGSCWYNECLVMNGLFRWSVPVFAMLTGFFLLDPNKKISIDKLFGKYLARIVIALLFWSIFYAVSLKKSIYPFGSQEGHFWYLEMLIGLYLSIPVLRLVAQNQLVLKYFCVSWVVYRCYLFMGSFIVLPFQLQDVIFLRYAGYCLIAFFIKSNLSSNEKYNKQISAVIYMLGGFGLLTTVLGNLLFQVADNPMSCYDSPNVIITAVALFLFFVRHPLRLNNSLSSLIEEVSKCTFGIYLMHLWVLIQVFFRLHRFVPSPIPLSIICVVRSRMAIA